MLLVFAEVVRFSLTQVQMMIVSTQVIVSLAELLLQRHVRCHIDVLDLSWVFTRARRSMLSYGQCFLINHVDLTIAL